MIPLPEYKLGVLTRYLGIPEPLLDSLMDGQNDDNVRSMLMGHLPFRLSDKRQILDLELVPTPEGYPELGEFMFKARIAQGRERLGDWILRHWYCEAVQEWTSAEDTLVCSCDKCNSLLILSKESLIGVSY